MARSIYITGFEPGGGKSAIALGLAEMLSRTVERLGIFRPLVRRDPDPAVELVHARYEIPLPLADLGGIDYALAHAAIGQGRTQELVTEIVERYRHIERASDAVIIIGTDFGHQAGDARDEPGLPGELGLNLRLAGEMGALVLPIVNAEDREPDEVSEAIRTAYHAVVDRSLSPLAVIANRVDPRLRDGVAATVSDLPVPVYAVPEIPVVSAPTIEEVMTALDARPVLGVTPESRARDVLGVVIGGATVPTFLDHLGDGKLVVTPGDRADLVVASFAAQAAGTASLAGIVLTLGLDIDEQVADLVRRPGVELPIVSVQTDSYETASALGGLTGRITASNPRKVEAALGVFEQYVDTAELGRSLDVARSDRMTPLMFEFDLIERARVVRRHIVLPEGTEERILRAAESVLRRGVCDLTLLGPEEDVRRRARELGLDLSEARIMDPAVSPLRTGFAAEYARLRAHRGVTEEAAYDRVADVNYFGTMLVHVGHADAMVSGAAHPTADTIRPAFEIIRTIPGVSVASSVFFMCLADRVLVYGDCAINPDPSPVELADIALSSARTAAQFGIEPRVAMLSYSTGTSGRGSDVEKVAEATGLLRSQDPDLLVEGPIQYDAAVDPTTAAAKLPDSAVAGRATVLIFPDLNTGNNTYKAVQRSAGAVAVGPVMQGLRKPVNDLSRGATVRDIVNTIAITAIQAGQDV